MNPPSCLLTAFFLSALALRVLHAQNFGYTPRTDTAQIPSYDLVSIHKTPETTTGQGTHDTPDGFSATRATLRSLVAEAYGFSLGQLDDQLIVTNTAAWSRTPQYDIQAKVDSSDIAKVKELDKAATMMAVVHQTVTRTPTFRMIMLQRLLDDRFHVKIHYEQKVMALYEVIPAKSGIRMKPAHPTDPEHGSMEVSKGKLTGDNVPMAFIPLMFAMELQRPVEDKTATEGNYDFELHWAPLQSTADPTNDSAPSLFTAVEEQLGLKLHPTKGPVWVIVIDHADPPSEN